MANSYRNHVPNVNGGIWNVAVVVKQSNRQKKPRHGIGLSSLRIQEADFFERNSLKGRYLLLEGALRASVKRNHGPSCLSEILCRPGRK